MIHHNSSRILNVAVANCYQQRDHLMEESHSQPYHVRFHEKYYRGWRWLWSGARTKPSYLVIRFCAPSGTRNVHRIPSAKIMLLQVLDGVQQPMVTVPFDSFHRIGIGGLQNSHVLFLQSVCITIVLDCIV